MGKNQISKKNYTIEVKESRNKSNKIVFKENKGKFIRAFPNHPPYYSSHNVQAKKKKAPKKILMKKKYSMALTNITSLLYKVHKNTHTILHYNNLCTRLLYQHQLSRAYNCSKNASEKKYQRLTKD